ncbi:MAG: cohesin domain-containing protein [Candidatus Dojkabacteria bacterium]
MIGKNILKIICFIILFNVFCSKGAYAAQPSFAFYPKGGQVLNKSQGFIVDVLVDTAGQEVATAKFVVLFDPTVLQLTKAERNNTLFKQWPNDESTLDNENGVIMLSGFTQSGSGTLYKSGTKPDVLARLTFKILKEGSTILDWEYGGNNGVFDTALMKDGSPPTNILTTKPSAVTFAIGKDILNPGNIDTGIPIDRYLLFTGLVLILFGAFMVFTRPGNLRKKSGTIVVYDGDK